MDSKRKRLLSKSGSTLAFVCRIALLVCCSAVMTRAQDGKTSQRGFLPAGSYAISDLETINTVNGNLMLHIPMVSLPKGRAGTTGAGVGLIYNSKGWDTFVQEFNDFAPNGDPIQIELNHVLGSPSGWHYRTEFQLFMNDRLDHFQTPPPCTDLTAIYANKLTMLFPDGSVHEFRPQGFTDRFFDGYFDVFPDGYHWVCQFNNGVPQRVNQPLVLTTMTYYSTDGSYLRLDFQHDTDSNWRNNPWTLYFPDGRQVTGGNAAQRIYDRNGNFIKIQNIDNYNNTGHAATQLHEKLSSTVSRKVVIEYDTVLSRDYIHMWGVNNEEIVWTVKWKNIAFHKTVKPTDDPNYTGVPDDINGPFAVVDQIVTPTQAGSLAYTFDYNAGISDPSFGWGEVSSVTLPTGAQAAYQYSLDGQNNIFWWELLKGVVKRKDLTYLREYDGTSTQTTETWNYFTPTATIESPDGGQMIDYHYPDVVTTPRWQQNLSYKSQRADGTVVERIWQPNTPAGTGLDMNAIIKTEFTSVKDSIGNLVKTAIRDFNYDKNGNVTQVADYDWVDYSTVPRDADGKPTGIPAGASPRRVSVNTYYSPTPDASDSSTDNPNVYHKQTSPQLRGAIESSEARSGFSSGQALSRTEFFYDNATTTGNLIQQTSWDSTKGGITRPLTTSTSISVSHQYDGYGNLTLTTDAGGTQAQFAYGAVNGITDLYATQTTVALGTPVQRITTQDYDFYTGLATTQTDVDNSVTTSMTYDAFGRLTLTQEAHASTIERRTATEYSDLARRVIVRSDLSATGDGKLVRIEHYDQLGRIRVSRQLEDVATQSAYDETTGIKLQTRYLYSNPNSYRVVSNPYRAATSGAASSEGTMGWTRSKLDQIGRVLEVQSFGGTGLPAPWGSNSSTTGTVITAYDSNNTTVTDQAGKQRRRVADGLGRLTQVVEDPAGLNYATNYVYDALDNLTTVTQGTQPSRSFVYSSLKRLTSAFNPESGTVNYTLYDGNGNLQTKTDARGITTTYAYDALNRATSRSYSDTTPAVSYAYDALGVPFSKGRLTSVSSRVSSYSYGEYDALGRVKTGTQTTSAQSYTMSYGYDLAGNMSSETYPSGRVVTTSYDGAGRVGVVNGQKAGEAAKTYASSFSYTAHGAVGSMTLGNNLVEHTNFNSRLQPTLIGLGTSSIDSSKLRLDYGYGAADNNGNVQSQTITVGATVMSQSYGYDGLNRLSSAAESGAWTQTYDFDRYGNRAVRAGSYIPNASLTPQSAFAGDLSAFNANNNRVQLTGFGYDSAGNLTSDPTTAANAMAYDAENRQISYTKAGVTTTYSYDGDGRRVKKIDSTGTTVFVYNAEGQLIAEYHSDPVPSPAGGGGTSYLTNDHLGSTRVVTKADGSVKARYDYLPFGEELGAGVGSRTTAMGYNAADSTKQKFTQKERDNESGLDYFLARYYSSAQGRFTSTDPIALAASRLKDPQQINLYAYVRNNPLSLVDPNGEDTIETKVEEYSFTIEREGKDKKGRTWRFSAKITVTERTVTRKDDDGNLIQRNTSATAKAENTDRAINQLSTTQLETVGQVASTIAETAAQSHFDRNVGFAIAQRETFFGANPPGSSSPYMNPAINPMQLTPNQFSDRRLQPGTDLGSNIFLSFLLFTQKAQGRSREDAFQRYGPGAGNAGGAAYGQDVSSKYNGINAETGGSIRTTNFLPRYDCCSRKAPNYTRQQ